ncbi:MAG: DNA-3-methyladenine glycosylase family protein [Bacillota bacterium]
MGTATLTINTDHPVQSRFSLQLQDPIQLRLTLFSGQSFTWIEVDGWFHSTIGGAHFCLAQSCNGREILVTSSLSELQARRVLLHYLDEHIPYGAVRQELCERDPLCAAAIPLAPGLRLLNQDPWETLVCFILSACNNIPRVTKTVSSLKSLAGGIFPNPQDILNAGDEFLRRAGAGFRAPYLVKAAQMVHEGTIDFESLRHLPTEQVIEELTTIPGVGRKVASCVALFSLGKRDAFPVDVWIKRALEAAYFGGRSVSPLRLEKFARERFGALSGYAQNWIYYWARTALRRSSSSTTLSSMT